MLTKAAVATMMLAVEMIRMRYASTAEVTVDMIASL
jgi:hypothetical protein